MTLQNSFIVYSSWREQVEALSDEAAGKLFKAAFRFNDRGELPNDLPGDANILFIGMRQVFDENATKWEAVRSARIAAGTKGGKVSGERRRNNIEAKEANASFAKQNEANEAVSGSVSVAVSDSVSIPPYGGSNDLSPAEIDCRGHADPRPVISAWNSLGLAQVQKVTQNTQRGKMFFARLNEYGVDTMLDAIEKVRQSDFLKGQNRSGWTITFDWFVKPSNFQKVLEGNYANKAGCTSGIPGTESGIDRTARMIQGGEFNDWK